MDITANTPQWAIDSIARDMLITLAADTPMVGMGATYGIGCDAYAYVVAVVESDKRIIVFRTGTENTRILTKRADGHWVQEGHPGGRKRIGTWTLGIAEDHRDPSY